MYVFDTTILTRLFAPDVEASSDPERARDRIDHFVENAARAHAKILIPTPVLSELLVRLKDEGPSILRELSVDPNFEIVPFDTRAAVEAATLTADAFEEGNKKGAVLSPWQKVKFDRMIVAIAKVKGAVAIYSDDVDVATHASRVGISVHTLSDMPLPLGRTERLPFIDSVEDAVGGLDNGEEE